MHSSGSRGQENQPTKSQCRSCLSRSLCSLRVYCMQPNISREMKLNTRLRAISLQVLPGALCKCVIWHWHVIAHAETFVCTSNIMPCPARGQTQQLSTPGTCLRTSHWHSIYLAIDLHVRDSSIFRIIYCTSLQQLNSTLSIFIFLTQSDIAIERGAWKTKWHLEVS